MPAALKLLTRTQFREGVLARAEGRCVFCDQPAVDAHHILERRLWSDGGYYIENGAAVCETHHILCEQTVIPVADVRIAAGIEKIVVPEHMYPDVEVDKWGNPLLEDGKRGWGELFFDESVQKVLGDADMLRIFIGRVRYPRTIHLPWSPCVQSDDRVMKDTSCFVEGERVIVTEKRDGECTTLYPDYTHARSLDSRGGIDRDWVKNLWSRIAHDIPAGHRICGENIWAKHSIAYDDLPSFFEGFSMWNERNVCLEWDEMSEYFDLLGIRRVPVLYDGPWSERTIRALDKTMDWDTQEGYVVRKASSFTYRDFKTSIAKWVRKAHVRTNEHWRKRISPNRLAASSGNSQQQVVVTGRAVTLRGR